MVPLSGSPPTIMGILLSTEIVWAWLGVQHGIWSVVPPQLAVSHIVALVDGTHVRSFDLVFSRHPFLRISPLAPHAQVASHPASPALLHYQRHPMRMGQNLLPIDESL